MVFMFGMEGTGAQRLNHLVTARVISQPSLSKKKTKSLSFLRRLIRYVSDREFRRSKVGGKSDCMFLERKLRSLRMFEVTVQKLGDVSVAHCKGRLVVGKAYSILCTTLLGQHSIRTLVLDLTQVERIDAGGLGVLLSMRARARADSIRLKLMNIPKDVEETLELTGLRRVFEFCSVQEMLCMLHRAAFVDSWSVHQSYAPNTESRLDPAPRVQEGVPLYGATD